MLLLLPAYFIQKLLFQEFFQELIVCQTVWIQIRTNILSVQILVQTVCKGHQQTTKVAVSKERKSYLEVIIPGFFLLVNNIKVENHIFFLY